MTSHTQSCHHPTWLSTRPLGDGLVEDKGSETVEQREAAPMDQPNAVFPKASLEAAHEGGEGLGLEAAHEGREIRLAAHEGGEIKLAAHEGGEIWLAAHEGGEIRLAAHEGGEIRLMFCSASVVTWSSACLNHTHQNLSLCNRMMCRSVH